MPRTPLISQAQIRTAVVRLGAEINERYGAHELTVVSVLHGALVFTADLIRRLDMPVRLHTVSARSYHAQATAPGELQVQADGLAELRDRHVLLVDDILDTGRTLAHLSTLIRAASPASLRLVALLDKPSRRSTPVQADFVGFEIPDVFVVGYGLDHDGRFRNLPDISVLAPAGTPGHADAPRPGPPGDTLDLRPE